jgi:hypothetical protein
MGEMSTNDPRERCYQSLRSRNRTSGTAAGTRSQAVSLHEELMRTYNAENPPAVWGVDKLTRASKTDSFKPNLKA